MRKLILLFVTMMLVVLSCTENKKIDSPIMGKYEFGFLRPEAVYLGELVFNTDGSMENNSKDNKEYTYQFDNDSILTIIESYNGTTTEETSFVVITEPADTTFLKMKSKIRYMGANVPTFMKRHTNEIPIVISDSRSDSTQVIAFLVKK